MAEPTYYPSFSPRDFPACAEAAQRALELAQRALASVGEAGAAEPDQALARKELAYAEAQAARFANGTAQQPERDAAQRRYAEMMEAAGGSLGAHPFHSRDMRCNCMQVKCRSTRGAPLGHQPFHGLRTGSRPWMPWVSR